MMRYNVIVLGGTGMLGHMVVNVLSQDKVFRVLGTQFDNKSAENYFNVFDGVDTLERISASLLSTQHPAPSPLYFINCIGALAHQMKEDDPVSVERAEILNARFPHNLAAFAKKYNARVIHMSTDGVFAPDHAEATEDQTPDAPDMYGKTKASGEVQVPHVLNIRTSIIGPSPHLKAGIYEWFMGQRDGATISGYTNQIWRGVTTRQFAELCLAIIKQDAFDDVRGTTRAIHFVPNHTVTKLELLNIFNDVSQKKITINSAQSPQPLARTLTATNTAWHSLVPHDLSMRDAIESLVAF